MTTTNTELKPVEYAAVEVGETLGPLELTVDDHLLKTYAWSLDDHHPWHRDAASSPSGDRVAPAAFFLGELLRLLNTRYDPNRDLGLHQREEVWFDSPARLGETVRLEGRIVEKYVKRGRGYYVTEAEARSTADGRLICRHRAIEAVEIGDPTKLGTGSAAAATQQRRVVGEYPQDRAPASYARPDVAVGTPLPTLTKVVHQDQISVYSNVASFWRTTHTDLAVARGQGLDTTLAQGLMNACYVSELATGFFGPEWLTAGHLELAFVAPMAPEDEVRVRGVVSDTSTKDDARWVEAEVWVERLTDGRKLAVGWADTLLRAV